MMIDSLLTSLHQALEDQRPCVIIADSGGIATEIYNYFSKELLPEVGEGGKGPNQDYVDKVAELLPKVKEMGRAQVGANKSEQVKFFHSTQELGGEQKELDVVILEAILADCDSTVDAIVRALPTTSTRPPLHSPPHPASAAPTRPLDG